MAVLCDSVTHDYRYEFMFELTYVWMDGNEVEISAALCLYDVVEQDDVIVSVSSR